ncbi:uncharacterized protein LOC115751161 isoform X3 [Rhodamnia argentea]|uniref:Uncharacterized protein LOC115751161 isoform X3 n=1 Tax=Rhodamnia argentea TaxID=178133 RepID=A0A8B8QC92_9MYRT|nr:uncharacterized protein LOC115751161 isoform X3 [Rhodamnia argentea]
MRSSNAQDDRSRALHELCSMIAHIMKFPPPNALPVAASTSGQPRLAIASMAQVSPAASASLFVGISLALMLFGSVTFVIGLILMPWVVLLVLFFYVAGMVSALSVLARAIPCSASSLRGVAYKIGKFPSSRDVQPAR